MPLKTLVKVGSVTNLSDARYCAGMGVDFLGFQVIQGQENYIAAKAFQEIRGWVTGPQIVAEAYGLKDPSEIKSIMENYRPDFLEIGLKELSVMGSTLTLPYILRLENAEDLPAEIFEPSYILISLDSSHQEKVVPGFDVLLAVSNKNELQQALQKTGVAGVCLNGSSEIKPGLKDFNDLAEILEYLEVED